MGSLEIIPLTGAVARLAGTLLADLKTTGSPLAFADVLIAATALSSDLILVTNNEGHFRQVPGLRVENWMRS